MVKAKFKQIGQGHRITAISIIGQTILIMSPEYIVAYTDAMAAVVPREERIERMEAHTTSTRTVPRLSYEILAHEIYLWQGMEDNTQGSKTRSPYPAPVLITKIVEVADAKLCLSSKITYSQPGIDRRAMILLVKSGHVLSTYR